MQTINVIGAGIAGSIMSTLLRDEGYNVRVIDDNDPCSASQASSNLFVADWYKKEGEKAELGFKVLERLYGKYTEKPFAAGIKIATKMLHIPQRYLLVRPDIVHTVTHADEQGVTLGDGRHFEGPIILCCGYRHNHLGGKAKLDIEVYAGHRYLFKGLLPLGGRLDMVAPYKHGKLYQYTPELIYYADSVKIKLDQYRAREEELRERTLQRAKAAIGVDLPVFDFRVGYRPVIKEHGFATAGRTRQLSPVWYINGGGKNGCVAYAYWAQAVLADIRSGL